MLFKNNIIVHGHPENRLEIMPNASSKEVYMYVRLTKQYFFVHEIIDTGSRDGRRGGGWRDDSSIYKSPLFFLSCPLVTTWGFSKGVVQIRGLLLCLIKHPVIRVVRLHTLILTWIWGLLVDPHSKVKGHTKNPVIILRPPNIEKLAEYSRYFETLTGQASINVTGWSKWLRIRARLHGCT